MMNVCRMGLVLRAGAVLTLVLWQCALWAAEPLRIYTTRQDFLVGPFTQSFTEATGIETELIFMKSGLIERVEAEGHLTPADVVITNDAPTLVEMERRGLLGTIENSRALAQVPVGYRSGQDMWTGLTMRMRVIIASRARVPEGAVTSYADLADPRWRGGVCTRSGSHRYNRGLVAALVAHQGVEATEAWARQVVENFAYTPRGNDRAQARAIAEGECNLGLMNHYYYFKMLDNDEQRSWAEAIRMIFPDQDGAGTHANLSGIGVLAHTDAGAQAARLVAFLLSPEVQARFATLNGESPITAEGQKRLESSHDLGPFRADPLSMEAVHRHSAEAARLLDRAGWR